MQLQMQQQNNGFNQSIEAYTNDITLHIQQMVGNTLISFPNQNNHISFHDTPQ